jgi:hypothetical protein
MATDVRGNLAKLMASTLKETANWTYDEIRPISMPPRPWKPGMKIVADCSKALQMLCWFAQGPDPMNNGFGPYGNSQTIWSALQHLDAAGELLVGDIVTFGFDGNQHAAMVMTPGSDPLLWSFGHQGAPNTYQLSLDGRPAQYLRLPVPKYVPTPQDRLRAMTGWFAWVSWRLGEGDWRIYGKSNSLVRPSVPQLIPLSWWVRLTKFLLARKKGNQATT